MAGVNLPYSPLRWTLYDGLELFQDFDPTEPDSWALTTDFAIYRHYVAEGRTAPSNPFMSMMQALHDNSISQALQGAVTGRKAAAIMGGHKMDRHSPSYRDVVLLSRRLARAGILVCTGGGPGAMEASHLGAALAPASDNDLAEALAMLGKHPVIPALKKVVHEDGTIDQELAVRAHAWFKPAFEIAAAFPSKGESLAIPTWHYGHEPSTPLASHIAKYFQNSIREDGLLAIAQQGIIFAEGKAGTIQEIFQDATQNYYRVFDYFSPMVLFGVKYWTETIPVTAVLKSLLSSEDYKQNILLTDDVEAAAQFIERFNPTHL
jgi:predicted Rossmann-fold nucleotide-binding protein